MEECKEEKMKEDIRKGKSETEVSVPFSKFPMVKWLEWWNDCKKNYNGCRWYKAYADHLKSKNSEENAALWAKIAELETQIRLISNQPKQEKEEESVRTLGGEVS